MSDLLDELSHLEGAARVVWKDEGGELSSLGAALKQVETQVKRETNAAPPPISFHLISFNLV